MSMTVEDELATQFSCAEQVTAYNRVYLLSLSLEKHHYCPFLMNFFFFFWVLFGGGGGDRKIPKLKLVLQNLSCQNWKANIATKKVYTKKHIKALSVFVRLSTKYFY